jgi:tetratricopeptide (TPR) repeat protein
MQRPVSDWNILSKEKKPTTTREAVLNELYESFIDSEIDNLLETDETYQFQSTPLKTAEAIKADHRRQLKEELEQKELREHIVKAYDLIMNELPQRVSPAEFDQLKQEFNKSLDHFYEISQKPVEFIDQLSSFQEIYGISNESMVLIYSLAYTYLENQEFKNAESLLYFLLLLNPAISSFWFALGICLQNQGKDEESKIMFETAQALDSES